MVQEEIFQAGLGDVDVRQFGAGSRSQARDFRNERAASVGINVNAGAVGGTHFAHPSQRLQSLQQVRGLVPETQAATRIRRGWTLSIPRVCRGQ